MWAGPWGAPPPPSGWLPSGAQGSHRPSLRLPPPWPGDGVEVARRMLESLAQSLCHHSPSGRGRSKGRRGCPAPGPPETWPRDRQCGRPGCVTACSATEWATGCGLAVAPALLPRGSSRREEAPGAGSTLDLVQAAQAGRGRDGPSLQVWGGAAHGLCGRATRPLTRGCAGSETLSHRHPSCSQPASPSPAPEPAALRRGRHCPPSISMGWAWRALSWPPSPHRASLASGDGVSRAAGGS